MMLRWFMGFAAIVLIFTGVLGALEIWIEMWFPDESVAGFRFLYPIHFGLASLVLWFRRRA